MVKFFFAISENDKKLILEKKFTLQTPIIFASFGGMATIKILSNTNIDRVMTPKKSFLSITFKSLDKKFSKSGI